MTQIIFLLNRLIFWITFNLFNHWLTQSLSINDLIIADKKASTMNQPLISKQRYLHNPNSATTLTTNKLPTKPQVPLRSSGTMTLGCYGDRVPHHVNNSLRQAPTEVKFKPEMATKDPHYFTNCAASASLAPPGVCYPISEAKLSFGSFVW